MVVEIVLVAPVLVDVPGMVVLGEAFDPPLVVVEPAGGAGVVFVDGDGSPVLTMLNPQWIEEIADIGRVVDVVVPDGACFWWEGMVPEQDVERGLAVGFALAELTGAAAVVKGVER